MKISMDEEKAREKRGSSADPLTANERKWNESRQVCNPVIELSDFMCHNHNLFCSSSSLVALVLDSIVTPYTLLNHCGTFKLAMLPSISST